MLALSQCGTDRNSFTILLLFATRSVRMGFAKSPFVVREKTVDSLRSGQKVCLRQHYDDSTTSSSESTRNGVGSLYHSSPFLV